jgi:dTDP-4-dehydrorhamnose 3,5-epimerase
VLGQNRLTLKITATAIPEVMIIEPEVLRDHRGFFLESFNRDRIIERTGLKLDFVQDNHSHSTKGVLRGLHYQIEQAQGKLVRVVSGEIYDVAVDIRKSSPNFGCWVGEYLSARNFRQMWIPPGFAHGFLVVEDDTDVLYKTTAFYSPEYERTIKWNDSDLSIDWPIDGIEPLLSEKDLNGLPLSKAECFF